MHFGAVPIDRAEGAVLAHSLPVAGRIIKKGAVLSADDLVALKAAGHSEVLAAQLEAGDIGEDRAAERVARAVAGPHVRVGDVFTGRANLYAEAAGLVCIDANRLDALNRLDEGVTLATVHPFERVEVGQMLATVKIITFAVPERVVTAAEALARPGTVVSVAAFRSCRAGLVLTRLPATKPSVLAKRERVMRERLASTASTLAETRIVPHRTADVQAAVAELAQAGCDPILLFAASAIVDRGDVIPAALVQAGGQVVHLGMPVDPGNLLMLGRLGGIDVIGVPSCAGSPRLNGFDWVLERRLAGLAVGRNEVASMGLGGLLKEIASRPQPRESEAQDRSDRDV